MCRAYERERAVFDFSGGVVTCCPITYHEIVATTPFERGVREALSTLTGIPMLRYAQHLFRSFFRVVSALSVEPQAFARVAVMAGLSVVFHGATPSIAAIPAAERAVLVSLYNDTGGAAWTNTAASVKAWTVSAAAGNECDWYGVVCAPTTTGHTVAEINLQANNLVGSLPASLNTLSALQYFRAQGNALTGALPSLTGLTALEYLDVRRNQLNGVLPALTGLTALRVFSFERNQFSGAIPSLSGLNALQIFWGSNNQLSGNIPSLSGLSALQLFYVDSNQLNGPIPALSSLTSLQAFYAGFNQLSGGVPALAGLGSLEYVRLENNQLTGALPTLAGLSALKVFYVANNQLSGAIPPVPTPINALVAGQSALCPNQFTVTTDLAWDTATGTTPWSTGCTAPLASQSLAFATAPILNPGITATVSATSTPSPGSSAPIVYASLTPAVCSVVASTGAVTVLPLAAIGDVCTISADKAGDSSFNVAPQVQQSMPVLKPINGSCGSANAVASNAAPSANLCAVGGASAVTSATNQFSWSCAGADGGTTASCVAPRQYAVTATAGANGTLSCTSANVLGGQTTSCTAVPAGGFITQAISGCSGVATAPAINAYTTGAITQDCTVSASFVAIVNGACGADNGVATVTAPSAGLCTAGTASAVSTGAASFTWSCNGANTGTTASCTAARNYVITPVVSGGNGTVVSGSPANGVVGYNATGTVIVTPNPGYVTVTPVGGSCGGTLNGTTYTTSPVTASCTVTASFIAGCRLDVDDDGELKPETDGVLILRYLLGIRGNSLIEGLNLTGGRVSASTIRNFLVAQDYDVRGASPANASGLRDGLAILRYLQKQPAAAMIAGTGIDPLDANAVFNRVDGWCVPLQ
jgi:hypothetical protein